MPPKRKSAVAKAAQAAAAPAPAAPVENRVALVPLELMQAIEEFLKKQKFEDVEHILIPIRMGVVRTMTTRTEPPPETKP